MNYRYWKERSQAEMTDDGVRARQNFYEGTLAYRNSDFDTAAKKFKEGLTIWDALTKNYTAYRNDDLNRKDTGIVLKRVSAGARPAERAGRHCRAGRPPVQGAARRAGARRFARPVRRLRDAQRRGHRGPDAGPGQHPVARPGRPEIAGRRRGRINRDRPVGPPRPPPAISEARDRSRGPSPGRGARRFLHRTKGEAEHHEHRRRAHDPGRAQPRLRRRLHVLCTDPRQARRRPAPVRPPARGHRDAQPPRPRRRARGLGREHPRLRPPGRPLRAAGVGFEHGRPLRPDPRDPRARHPGRAARQDDRGPGDADDRLPDAPALPGQGHLDGRHALRPDPPGRRRGGGRRRA